MFLLLFSERGVLARSGVTIQLCALTFNPLSLSIPPYLPPSSSPSLFTLYYTSTPLSHSPPSPSLFTLYCTSTPLSLLSPSIPTSLYLLLLSLLAPSLPQTTISVPLHHAHTAQYLLTSPLLRVSPSLSISLSLSLPFLLHCLVFCPLSLPSILFAPYPLISFAAPDQSLSLPFFLSLNPLPINLLRLPPSTGSPHLLS